MLDELRAYVADVTREAESALSGLGPSLGALRAFTLNELYIAPYDLRAFALFLQKASEDDELEFVMGLLQGGPRWLRGLRGLASELGVSYSPDLVSPEGFSSHIGCCLTVIASSLFPRTPLGASSGLGAFRATPGAPHLECTDTYLLYMFIVAMTSLSPSRPHLGHLSLLWPTSTSLAPHLGHVDDVPLGFTLAIL
ncbi:MAG: hypothetical protein JCHSAcid_05650 [uncultured Acidilobus sp. JCHS]|nr:MAG: hypothetical protein JCHSAcid_05650 [uncultured Acidilobus sp. JCHS]